MVYSIELQVLYVTMNIYFGGIYNFSGGWFHPPTVTVCSPWTGSTGDAFELVRDVNRPGVQTDARELARHPRGPGFGPKDCTRKEGRKDTQNG